MGNVLQFTIKLTDMMSATLKKVAGSGIGVEQAFKNITASQEKMRAAMGQGTESINSLNKKIKELQTTRNLLPDSAEKQIRSINSEVNKLTDKLHKLETMNGSKLKSWAGDAFNQLPFAGLLQNPLVIAGAAATYSVKEAMGVQMNKVKFGTLMGSDKAGDAMYKQLKDYADVTPYRKDDILKGGETLLNFGVNTQKIMPTMKMLGDISGGSAERLESLSLAFGEVTASGHLTGKEVLQMVNAGFNPLQAMSQRTGKSMETLSGMMREGQITVGMVEDAMKSATGEGGRFHNMMIKLGGTLQGQLSTFMDKVQNTMANLGAALMPMATRALQFLNVALEKTVGFFSGLFGWMEKHKGALIALAASIAAAVVTYWGYYAVVNAAILATKLKMFWDNALIAVEYGLIVVQELLNAAFLASPLGWVMLGVAAIVGTVTLLASRTKDAVSEQDKMNKSFSELSSTMEINNRVQKKANDNSTEAIVKANMLIAGIKDNLATEKERRDLIKELHDLDEKTFKNINNQADAYNKGAVALDAYTKKMFEHAQAMAGVEEIKDITKNAIELVNSNREHLRKTTYTHKAWKKGVGLRGGYMDDVEFDKDTQERMRTNSNNNFLKSTMEATKKATDYIVTTFVKKDSDANKALKDMNAPVKAATAGINAGDDDNTAKGIASGGPRVVNINIQKLVEKIELHSASAKEGVTDFSEQVKDALLRVLYSGAKMQS